MTEVNVKAAQHTPGPWVYQPGALNVAGEDGVGSVTTDEAEPWYIAKIEAAPCAEANARLIAAAPDMYEALKNVQKLISEAAMTGFNWKDGDWPERLFASQQVTSRAIAKAEAR